MKIKMNSNMEQFQFEVPHTLRLHVEHIHQVCTQAANSFSAVLLSHVSYFTPLLLALLRCDAIVISSYPPACLMKLEKKPK
jgi:hypothetical protein